MSATRTHLTITTFYLIYGLLKFPTSQDRLDLVFTASPIVIIRYSARRRVW